MLEIKAEKYIAGWYEDQNIDARMDLREQLDRGLPVRVSYSPGDGTRYEMLLVQMPEEVGVSKDRVRRAFGEKDIMYATILNGLGDGVGTFNRLDSDGDRDYIMASIRHRISDKMKVGNPHTVEALTATIFTLWYMDD